MTFYKVIDEIKKKLPSVEVEGEKTEDQKKVETN